MGHASMMKGITGITTPRPLTSGSARNLTSKNRSRLNRPLQVSVPPFSLNPSSE